MKLNKVYGVLKFKQSDLLNKHIDFITEKEKALLIVLEKNFLS